MVPPPCPVLTFGLTPQQGSSRPHHDTLPRLPLCPSPPWELRMHPSMKICGWKEKFLSFASILEKKTRGNGFCSTASPGENKGSAPSQSRVLLQWAQKPARPANLKKTQPKNKQKTQKKTNKKTPQKNKTRTSFSLRHFNCIDTQKYTKGSVPRATRQREASFHGGSYFHTSFTPKKNQKRKRKYNNNCTSWCTNTVVPFHTFVGSAVTGGWCPGIHPDTAGGAPQGTDGCTKQYEDFSYKHTPAVFTGWGFCIFFLKSLKTRFWVTNGLSLLSTVNSAYIFIFRNV